MKIQFAYYNPEHNGIDIALITIHYYLFPAIL